MPKICRVNTAVFVTQIPRLEQNPVHLISISRKKTLTIYIFWECQTGLGFKHAGFSKNPRHIGINCRMRIDQKGNVSCHRDTERASRIKCADRLWGLSQAFLHVHEQIISRLHCAPVRIISRCSCPGLISKVDLCWQRFILLVNNSTGRLAVARCQQRWEYFQPSHVVCSTEMTVGPCGGGSTNRCPSVSVEIPPALLPC